MKRIPLNKGKFALVDDDDYEELSKFKWYADTRRDNVYSARRSVSRGGGRRGTVIMARVIAKATSEQVVYHRNGDGLDNRMGNLLVCLRSKFAQQ